MEIQKKRYDNDFKVLAITEAVSRNDVRGVAYELGISFSTLYKWIYLSKKQHSQKVFPKDYTSLYDELSAFIEDNHHDLCGCFSDSEAEERTEELIKLCLQGIPGFKRNLIDLLKSGKNNPGNTKSKFFKRFCYVIYELED